MKSRIYYAADYGVLPCAGDCAGELQALFDSITDGSSVVFKTGSYYLSRLITVKGKSDIKIFGNLTRAARNPPLTRRLNSQIAAILK